MVVSNNMSSSRTLALLD